jgi:hypothetical protein
MPGCSSAKLPPSALLGKVDRAQRAPCSAEALKDKSLGERKLGLGFVAHRADHSNPRDGCGDDGRRGVWDRSPAGDPEPWYPARDPRDSSDWDVWAFKAKLHLQSGTRCFGPEVCTAKQGVLPRAGYLHQSPSTKVQVRLPASPCGSINHHVDAAATAPRAPTARSPAQPSRHRTAQPFRPGRARPDVGRPCTTR